MSYYDYQVSRPLADNDPPFYSLIMAAMRRADSINAVILRAAYPEVWEELQERYSTPGGFTAAELEARRERGLAS